MKNAYWGCTETSFKLSSKYCTPVPHRNHSICWYQQLDGWMASWPRTRRKFELCFHIITFLSTQASEVFQEFHLNVSLISDAQMENQDHHV